MKQGFIISVIIIALFIGGFWVKQKLNEIEVKVQSVRFLQITRTGIFGEFTIKVIQPFGELDLSNLQLNFYLNDLYISDINQADHKTTIVGNDIVLTARFSIDPEKVFTLQNIMGVLQNLNNLNYTIKGDITAKKYALSCKIPIDISDKFKVN